MTLANLVQFIYLCLKLTYMQIIIKMQRRPAKGLCYDKAASMQATLSVQRLVFAVVQVNAGKRRKFCYSHKS